MKNGFFPTHSPALTLTGCFTKGGEQEKDVVVQRKELNNNTRNNFHPLSDAKQREMGGGIGFVADQTHLVI